MASAAEQLAANVSLGTFQRATELKQRLWFTLGALLVFRVGTFVPVPGVDLAVVAEAARSHSGGLLALLDASSGGGLSRMSVFALSIVPYVTASVIVGLLSVRLPRLAALRREGEPGRRKLHEYMRYLTVLVALVQSCGIAVVLEGIPGALDMAVPNPVWLFRISCVISLIGGATFLMWLAEQITTRGVGNGLGLILAVGIVANLPSAMASLLELGRTGTISAFVILAVLLAAVVIVAAIVFVERAQRRIPVQYQKRQVGNRMFGGDSTQMPLKINTSGALAPILAISLLSIPGMFAGFGSDGSSWPRWILRQFEHGQLGYIVLFAALLVLFSLFYMDNVFNPEDTADNLRKNGGFVPGIRAGSATVAYFDRILTRLTAVGGLYLIAICVLPDLCMSGLGLPFYFSGTGILIAATVIMDTVTQVQSHLLAHQYEGAIRKNRVKGRR
jgi:preprotein translocase subunit SecY